MCVVPRCHMNLGNIISDDLAAWNIAPFYYYNLSQGFRVNFFKIKIQLFAYCTKIIVVAKIFKKT